MKSQKNGSCHGCALLSNRGNKPYTGNVRPISLTSVLCKLGERIALARVEWSVERKCIFHPALRGFRKHLDTQDKLALLHECLFWMLLNAEQAREVQWQRRLLVALDIRKVFDTMAHETVVDTARNWKCVEDP